LEIDMSLMDILNRYAEPNEAAAATSEAHFNEVVGAVPSSTLGQGVAETLRSDRTPPLGDMVAQMFGQSNPQQRAGLLNQILGSLGPGALSGIAGGVLGRVLGGAGASPAAASITPEQASQLTPAQVNEIATHAERHDPSLADKVGSFYGEHPEIVKGLGAMALAVLLGKMAKR
jgi:hypothetical protein